MTPEGIKDFRDRKPFEAFEIVLVDGRTFHVPHPEFIWLPPKGTWVYVAQDNGRVEHVNTLIISSIRLAPGKGGRGRRKKAG